VSAFTTMSIPTGPDSDRDLELEIAAFHQPAIDSARKMIFWAGLFYPIQPLLAFAMLARYLGAGVFATSAFALIFGVGCAIFAGHVALWWWAKRSPFPATLVALAVFLVYIGLVVHYGTTGNLLLPIIGLVILVRAVLASYRVHKLRRRAGLGVTGAALTE
jgi:hypothetical protein